MPEQRGSSGPRWGACVPGDGLVEGPEGRDSHRRRGGVRVEASVVRYANVSRTSRATAGTVLRGTSPAAVNARTA